MNGRQGVYAITSQVNYYAFDSSKQYTLQQSRVHCTPGQYYNTTRKITMISMTGNIATLKMCTCFL